jgi:hypothetical protein
MRGDFSRIRFNRLKGYTAVLDQQGRVALDADANEQCFTDDYLRRSETVDVIGEYGGPKDDAGFEINVEGDEIEIGAGRYYVDGLLCENPAPISYDAQQFLLGASPSAAELLEELPNARAGSVVQVYLETWQRFVTALDDPCLREPALGQADTTGRLQTVWRVLAALESNVERTRSADVPAGLTPCCQAMYETSSPASTGTMSAETTGAASDCGCEPVAAAGYQGVENQLYRIEIHLGGGDTEATFKWSRENGSVVSAVTEIAGATVTVNSLGRDANLGFGPQQWVELSDDHDLFGELPNQPGGLYQIEKIQPADPSVTLAGTVTPVDPASNARLRRWDQSGPAAGPNGIALAAGTWIELENGIQVSFTPGTYQSGDHWTIPARAATGEIEWPPCGGDGEPFQPPTSIEVRRAPLACIHWQPPRFVDQAERELAGQAAGHELAPEAAIREPAENILKEIIKLRLPPEGFVTDDCRVLFEPLTVLTTPVTPEAMRVEKVSWVNDDITTLDALVAKGLTVRLNQEPASPVNGANFIVTIEAAVAAGKDDDDTKLFAVEPDVEAQSATLRELVIVDAEVEVDRATLEWQLSNGTRAQRQTLVDIEELILPGARLGSWARVRVRLLGQMIFAQGENGMLFLDGQAFGKSAFRADGRTPRIDLQLPSGQQARASDLDGWFYLAPTLRITSVEPNYSSLTVLADSEKGVIVEATGTKERVTPEATGYLNYPVFAATRVELEVKGSSGIEAIVSVPSSVETKIGEASFPIPIKILANPGKEVEFTIGAAVTDAAGTHTAQSETIVLAGIDEDNTQ